MANATKFAVQTLLDGNPVNTYTGKEAFDLMEMFVWPAGTQWPQHIPILPPKPPRFIGEADNLNFVQEMDAWNVDKFIKTSIYAIDIMTAYPTVRFVLLASDDGKTWREAPELFTAKMYGFIRATILWKDKDKIMRRMLGM